MIFTHNDILELKSILAACKVIGVDGVVIHEGLVRGATASIDAAIISTARLSISEALRLGIGRVTELDKRLSIFSDQLQIEGKSTETGDVSMLTLSSGKSKVQYRCTSTKLMKYPKTNADEPLAVITMNRTEVMQLSKAVRTLSSETVVLQVACTGVARLECMDSASDRFEVELNSPVQFVEEADSAVRTYLARMLVDVLDAVLKEETEEISFVLGQAGSITITVKTHTLLLMAQIGD